MAAWVADALFRVNSFTRNRNVPGKPGPKTRRTDLTKLTRCFPMASHIARGDRLAVEDLDQSIGARGCVELCRGAHMRIGKLDQHRLGSVA